MYCTGTLLVALIPIPGYDQTTAALPVPEPPVAPKLITSDPFLHPTRQLLRGLPEALRNIQAPKSRFVFNRDYPLIMPEDDKDSLEALDALESEAKEWEKDAEIERILNAFRLDAYVSRDTLATKPTLWKRIELTILQLRRLRS